MKSRSKSNLSSSDIPSIIAACAASQIRVLKYADLYLEFDRPVEPPSEGPPAPASNPTVAEITDTQKNDSRENHELDELAFREDQLAELLITDPHAAEQMVINGQLEESDVGTPGETRFNGA